MVRSLALACCRGDRQIGIVNELLDGPVNTNTYSIGSNVFITYGKTRIQHKSFVALKSRLLAAGFVFPADKEHKYVYDRIITMYFPENLIGR